MGHMIVCVYMEGCPDLSQCSKADACLLLDHTVFTARHAPTPPRAKCPFKLPVRMEIEDSVTVLVTADHELVCHMEAATRQEAEFIVAAINAYEGEV